MLAFGCASAIDVAARHIQNTIIGANISVATSHIYLLSAIIALWGTTFSCPSIPVGLTLFGDILFALGSVIDVVLSYVQDGEIHFHKMLDDRWWCLSSALWLIDAWLYFLSDITVI